MLGGGDGVRPELDDGMGVGAIEVDASVGAGIGTAVGSPGATLGARVGGGTGAEAAPAEDQKTTLATDAAEVLAFFLRRGKPFRRLNIQSCV